MCQNLSYSLFFFFFFSPCFGFFFLLSFISSLPQVAWEKGFDVVCTNEIRNMG
jgi:hypothetical protein